MTVELVTPDEKVFEGEVVSATIPGIDGSFQVLNDHADLISSLHIGWLKLKVDPKNPKEEVHYQLDGGVVEVKNNKITILAEAVLGEPKEVHEKESA